MNMIKDILPLILPRGIKNHIPLDIKCKVSYWLSSKRGKYSGIRKEGKKAIIALAADYPNMGDIAITVAQAKFIADCLPGHEIIFFPGADIYPQMKSLKSVCTPDDLVTIIGGGNMGDLYLWLEYARQFVIKQFPHNRIISFPQTADFSDTPRGRRELRKSCQVYSKHHHLYLFLREPISFERMKKYSPNTPVYMVPDIVLYLDKSQPVERRQGILVLLRDDLELAFPRELRNYFIGRLKSLFQDVNVSDTFLFDKSRVTINDIKDGE
ncbi:MAG: polysaccharide pyruvyl transferase family protein, partial [bacterium]